MIKLKQNKTPGDAEIRNEAWKNANEELHKRIPELHNEIWKEGKLPEDWKSDLIVALHIRKTEKTQKTIVGSQY